MHFARNKALHKYAAATSVSEALYCKMYFFVFCRKIIFDFKISSNDVSEWKKHLKVDSDTRCYHFLTKTREIDPMSPFILILGIT